jgi:2-polyprenyl-3-methyl-5-hydroxy-6-metoxy-1,4-benzoquinol methylase
MAIIKYNYEKSKELGEELESLAMMVRNCMDEFGGMPLQNFIGTFTETVQGLEFIDAVKMLEPHSQVIDIGVGFGQSSMYLASQGHRVTAIEPSEEFCRFLEYFSNKFDLNIEIHQCSIEAFNSDRKFDVGIFNASFHHCSEPKAAMVKCHGLLKDKGRIFLINENMLKFYRTKNWFYKTLKKNPGKLDHYGGNEHAYRHAEYVRIIKQGGFSGCIEKIPVFYKDIRSVFVLNCNKQENRRYKYSEPQLIARFLFYYFIWRIIKIPVLTKIAKRLSLILCTYIGVK